MKDFTKTVYAVRKAYVYNYEITFKKYKQDALMITVTDHQWDTHDYAFVKLSNLTVDGIYSYSPVAADFVKAACVAANVFV